MVLVVACTRAESRKLQDRGKMKRTKEDHGEADCTKRILP